MQVVILAGGLWTRLAEETTLKPKPMVEIWGKPILWHIMKIYAAAGYTKFIICLWYKGHYIKEWFKNYLLYNADFTVNTSTGEIIIHNTSSDNWEVTLVDTWDESLTWGRIKRVWSYIHGDQFMMTYWDGVSDIDISKLVAFHNTHGKLATLTAIVPEGRFGKLEIENGVVTDFGEKKDNSDKRVNGWFMVLNKKVLEYIDWDAISFEKEPLEKLAKIGELMAYKHDGFRFAMDTLKQKNDLENLRNAGGAPWKIW